jgi:cardiolipin synthase C
MRWPHRVLVCLLLSGLAACATLQRPELPIEAALPPSEAGVLDRTIAPAEIQHPGESAFRLLVDGPEAFVMRMQSARKAARSLDVQTYIWHADLTGIFLAHQLVEAADRGVKVRLLLDDMDARAKNAGFAAMAAHPNIQVRMFNPFASRRGIFGLIGEGVTSFGRINRRMHNKSWIADNRIAIVGGRNVGDEYFGASHDTNFVDLDFAMIGPVVRDASRSFDRYWNSPSAYPMESLDRDGVSDAALDKLRALLGARAGEAGTSPYAVALRTDAVAHLAAGDRPMEWSPRYAFVADDPLKVTMQARDAQRTQVGAALLAEVEGMQTELTVISPYFVPGEATTEAFVAASASGKRVRVLTNSLAATDVAAVHGGYSRYREPLLAGGVQLWELKPLVGSSAKSSLLGSSGASLHTKAMVIDNRTVFVGSFNLDPRSTWLNSEQGVLVDSPVLSSQLEAIFATQTSGQHAWRVMLENGGMTWSDGKDTFHSDPMASTGRRFRAWLSRLLHLDAQL